MKFKSKRHFSTFNAVHHLCQPTPPAVPPPTPSWGAPLGLLPRHCPTALTSCWRNSSCLSASHSPFSLGFVAETGLCKAHVCFASWALAVRGIREENWERKRICSFLCAPCLGRRLKELGQPIGSGCRSSSSLLFLFLRLPEPTLA